MKQAELIYDGKDVKVPESMGQPKSHQNQGTDLERLAEIAGRVCYDSMGKGRSSLEWHKHILEVDHLSVYEHCPITISLPLEQFEGEHLDPRDCGEVLGIVARLMGRPGITARFYTPRVGRPGFLRINFNPRCVLDWDKLPFGTGDVIEHEILATLVNAAIDVAPVIMQKYIRNTSGTYLYAHVEPYFDTEKWCSFWLMGSRGWSHEQVRHGDFTAISQRSTRYVDESESIWHYHPLFDEYYKSLNSPSLRSRLSIVQQDAGSVYRDIVEQLEPWLIERGLDKQTARKQARGAARGFLGNALSTQMIFSASVWQWKTMLQQRMSPHADAEIRLIFNEVYEGLCDSAYGMDFSDFDVKESPDGMGLVLA